MSCASRTRGPARHRGGEAESRAFRRWSQGTLNTHAAFKGKTKLTEGRGGVQGEGKQRFSQEGLNVVAGEDGNADDLDVAPSARCGGMMRSERWRRGRRSSVEHHGAAIAPRPGRGVARSRGDCGHSAVVMNGGVAWLLGDRERSCGAAVASRWNHRVTGRGKKARVEKDPR